MSESPQPEPNKPTARPHGRLFRWFDVRMGLDTLLHEALDEPIPGGARLAYVFGSALMFLLISQTVTGVFLALYYVPSADHAHTTVSYIIKEVTGGSFLRSLHAYGSSAAVIVMLLHIAQTFIYGSYKGRRELLWISGCVLGGLLLSFAFTGYLLPWDQKAYFATTVGTNMASEVPGIGSWLKRFMRGGNEMGTLTLSRFFVAHVFILPALLLAFMAAHIYFFRKAGAAGPPSEDPIKPRMRSERFYPRQVVMDLAVAMLLIVALGLLSHFVPFEFGPKADPSDTQYLPRPEWYYLPAFQWLKYWKEPYVLLGIVVIPLLAVILFVALPFIDRKLERRPWRRPFAMAFFALGIGSLVTLGVLSVVEDRRDPTIAAQLRKQHEESERFMRAPFEPELAGSSLTAASVALADPLVSKGKRVYEDESCNACHGDKGQGTPDGSRLIGIGARFDAQQLTEMLRHPTPKMVEGGMTPVELKEDEMHALVIFMQNLQ